MWQPEPHWVPVPGGRGALTVGVWRAPDPDGRSWIVKRIQAAESACLSAPSYWRREAEVALADLTFEGLRTPEVRRVDEDEDGYTLWSSNHDRSLVEPERVAAALGQFAGSLIEPRPWHAEGHLRAKVVQSETHDGWPTLARTTVADLTDAFWKRRGTFLRRLEDMRRVPMHGDLVQANVLTIHDGKVVVIDWGAFGWGAPGEDLGLYALSANADPERLAWHYTEANPELASFDEVLWVARLTAGFTVLARAEWVLARVAPGEGALANKYRHPAVAPYLRALQRQLPAIEAVLES